MRSVSISLAKRSKSVKLSSEDHQPLSARAPLHRSKTVHVQEPGARRRKSSAGVETLAAGLFNQFRRRSSTIKGIAAPAGASGQTVENELANVALLKECSPAFLAFLAGDCEPTSYAPGDVIHEKGAFCSSLLLVLRGTLSVSRDDCDLMYLQKGQHIGETALFGLSHVWSVTLTAENACVVCEVERSTFQKALQRFSEENAMYSPVLAMPHAALTAGLQNRTATIFEGLSQAALKALDQWSITRLFFPGEKLLQDEEGAARSELLILVEGAVDVEITGRVVRTKACGKELDELLEHQDSTVADPDIDAQDKSPAFFGELEFLGANPIRNITVKAQSVCICRILKQETLHAINVDCFLERDKETFLLDRAQHDFQTNLESISRGSVLLDFSRAGCSQDFLEFLKRNLEVRLVTRGKTLWDGRSVSNLFHSVIWGSAWICNDVEKEVPERDLEDGEVFGNMTSLNMGCRPLAGPVQVTAITDCCVETLHQGVVVRALELFPEQRSKILLLEASNARKGRSQQLQKSHDFTEILKKSPFFSNMNPDFVQDLSLVAMDRIFMPGEDIMSEGDVGHSMFIMVNGSANVYMSEKSAAIHEKKKLSTKKKSVKNMGKVGHLAAGAVAGELAMLGIRPTRSATIQASSMCILWEVTQEKAMEILDRFPTERALFGTVIVNNLDITVPGRLLQLPLFKAFDRKFRMLVTLYCERHAFFPDHTIVEEGEVGDKLWILNLGPASLLKGNFSVRLLSPGSHFGCDNMLGISRCYICALKAVTVCHALSLNRLSYVTALEQYPSKAAHQALLKEQRTESQQLKEVAERTAMRKAIWQRYQGAGAQRKSVFFCSDDDLVSRMTQAWHEYTKTIREKRALLKKGQEELDDKIEIWRGKHEAAQRKASRRKRMKELIKSNLSERGPLRYMEDDDELVDVPQALPLLPRQHKQLVTALKAWPSPRPSPHYNLKLWGMMGEELSESGRDSTLLPMLSASPRGNVKANERTPRQVPHADLSDDDSDDEPQSASSKVTKPGARVDQIRRTRALS